MPTAQEVSIITPAAVSSPLVGVATGTNQSASFLPQNGRPIYITLTGTWTGTIQLQRSTDGGSSWNNVTTTGGAVSARWTVNADELILTPTDATSRYRLSYVLSGGSANYRIAQ